MADSVELFSYFVAKKHAFGAVPWSKSYEKRIALLGTLQLSSNFERKTRNFYWDQNYMTNDQCSRNLAVFAYFFVAIERHAVRTAMKLTTQMKISSWISLFIFLFLSQRLELHSLIESTWEMNSVVIGFLYLPSYCITKILSSLFLCGQLTNELFMLWISSVILYSHGKTSSPYFDWSHMTSGYC
jgi:hypothetical protein